MAGKKEQLTAKEFLREFERASVKPVYVFQGQETFLIEEAVEIVKQRLIQGSAADFNVDKFAVGGDFDIRNVLDLAQTMPFLSKWRLIIVTDVQELSASVQNQMVAYLSNPNPSTCLVFTATKLDSRTKFTQAVKQHGEIVQFWKLFDRDVPPWIMARAKREGYTIASQAATYLFELVGNDLRQLENELQKITAFLPGKEITPEAVRQVVGDVRERDVFELMEAMSTRDVAKALKILAQLLTEGEEPLKILAMMSRQFRLLWKTKAHLHAQRDLAAPQLAGKLGVSPNAAEQLQRQVQRFSQVQLKNSFKRLSDVDKALKTSSNAPNILLEALLFDLCSPS